MEKGKVSSSVSRRECVYQSVSLLLAASFARARRGDALVALGRCGGLLWRGLVVAEVGEHLLAVLLE